MLLGQRAVSRGWKLSLPLHTNTQTHSKKCIKAQFVRKFNLQVLLLLYKENQANKINRIKAAGCAGQVPGVNVCNCENVFKTFL